MNNKTLAYFEGTNPIFLTSMVARGTSTLPVGNGLDGHGKYVGLITKADNIGAVVGYLHKIIPTDDMDTPPEELLRTCILHKIPVLVVVPEELTDAARKLLGKIKEGITLVTPERLVETVLPLFK